MYERNHEKEKRSIEKIHAELNRKMYSFWDIFGIFINWKRPNKRAV